MVGYYIPYLFIVKTATQERGVAETSAVFLLSLIGKRNDERQWEMKSFIWGFTNTATRFVSGWITKLPHMSPLMVNNIGLTVAGVATLLVPFCRTHLLLIIYCLVWGGFIGKSFSPWSELLKIDCFCLLAFHVSLSPVIVCQIVGLNRYSAALGLTLMFRGITSLSAPPVRRWFLNWRFLHCIIFLSL